MVSAPGAIQLCGERRRRSGQSQADWCWSVGPAENKETASNNTAVLCLHEQVMCSHTHTEAADLCVLSFLSQGGVHPAEDDAIVKLLSINKLWQNPHSVSEGKQTGQTTETTQTDSMDSLSSPNNALNKWQQAQIVCVPPHQLPDQR